ncbi:MAG: ribosome-associated translation inhibitor RaiA [Elusimicrobia bacterium]|nr:ribosome-associated translation inhibitor RaiA [Elusimicrobiota bacterium]
MRIHITARNIDLTRAIADYLNRKVNRLERYFDHLVWANAILWVEKHRQLAEIVIHSPLHTLRAKEEAGDLYTAIDLVVGKMEKQLKKLKEKQKTLRFQNRRRKETLWESSYGFMAAPSGAPRLSRGHGKKSHLPASVSVVKQVSVDPMAIEDAIETMEKLGYLFWMFFNKNSRKLNVIFKRFDQTYGILEPAR